MLLPSSWMSFLSIKPRKHPPPELEDDSRSFFLLSHLAIAHLAIQRQFGTIFKAILFANLSSDLACHLKFCIQPFPYALIRTFFIGHYIYSSFSGNFFIIFYPFSSRPTWSLPNYFTNLHSPTPSKYLRQPPAKGINLEFECTVIQDYPDLCFACLLE